MTVPLTVDGQAACSRLIDQAKWRGGEDNVTAVVAGVNGDLPVATGESIARTFFVIREFQPSPNATPMTT